MGVSPNGTDAIRKPEGTMGNAAGPLPPSVRGLPSKASLPRLSQAVPGPTWRSVRGASGTLSCSPVAAEACAPETSYSLCSKPQDR